MARGYINYMKKNLNWLVCGVSGLSLVLSVVAVCVACCHTPDLGFDYQGVIVGVLSPFAENGKDAALSENLINDLCRHVTYEEVDCFMHDFLSVPDGRNHPQAHGLSQLLRRLILATLQSCHGQKAK